jgi:pimeloyl-ACP methyl ester carboxylesterase
VKGKVALFLILFLSLMLPDVAANAQPLGGDFPLPASTPLFRAGVPRFEPSACPVPVPPGEKVECGYLVVPENRIRNDNRAIRLAVIILPSRSADPDPDPVVFLAGGPGASAVMEKPLEWWLKSPLVEHRSLILFEQRGTRYSEPFLNCPEIDTETNMASAGEDDRYLSAIRKCRDRLLGEGIDLSAYSSAASVADLEDLREVLGYATWNVYGVSYGTRLALTAMRDRPAGIRSVVLDSAVPLQADLADIWPNYADGLDVLFGACAADPECRAAFPDLEESFYRVIRNLNDNPVPVSIHSSPGRVTITGDVLSEGIRMALQNDQTIPLLPMLIDQFDRGNLDVLTAVADNLLQGDNDDFGMGMGFSVDCFEELSFLDSRSVAAAAAAYPQIPLPFSGNRYFSVCPIWDVGRSGSIENEPVHSDIPALILAGQYDPNTPPAEGKRVGETLSHSYFFEFPGLTHIVTESGDPENCPLEVAASFLDHPAVSPDAQCIGQMSAVEFIATSRVYPTPAAYRMLGDLALYPNPVFIGLAAVCVILFLVEICRVPVRIIRWRKTASSVPAAVLLARGAAAAAAVLNVVFLLGLALAIQEALSANELMLAVGLPAAAGSLFLLPPVLAVFEAVLIVITGFAWKRKFLSPTGRIYYTLFTLCGLAFLLLWWHWLW